MFKKWNRILAFLLSIALVTTTFDSDFASAKVYAEENEIVEDVVEENSDDDYEEESDEDDYNEESDEKKNEEASLADVPFSEVIPENGNGNTVNEVTPEAGQNGENGAPASTDPDDLSKYLLDDDGNPILDDDGNPVLKEQPVVEGTEEVVVETEEVDGIKIYYVVSDEDAGYVDNDSDVFAEGKEITGSTAFENDGYTFVNWTDEDGKIVSKKANFTPASSDLGVSEDSENEESEEGKDEIKEVTFTANFEFEGPKYTLEFSRSKTVNGIKVSLYAVEGVIPNDAVLDVQPLSASEEQQVTDLIDGKTSEDVEKTISFDINIYAESLKSDENPEGKVQPKDDGTVQITFENVSEAADDCSLDVYHVSDSLSYATEIKGVVVDSKEEKVSFGVEHFSKYTIAISYYGNKKFTFYAYDVNNKSTALNTKNSSYTATTSNTTALTVSQIAATIEFNSEESYIFDTENGSYATVGGNTQISIKRIRYNYNRFQYNTNDSGNGSWTDFPNNAVVRFYFCKQTSYTVAAKHADYEQINNGSFVSVGNEQESFTVTAANASTLIKPANNQITVNGIKYNYKGRYVYEDADDQYYEITGYQERNGELDAIYYDSYYGQNYAVKLTSNGTQIEYVYFAYEAEVPKYTIKYDINGGTIYSSANNLVADVVNKEANSTVTVPENQTYTSGYSWNSTTHYAFTKDNFEFYGWSTDKDAKYSDDSVITGGTIYTVSADDADDNNVIKLYAVWKPDTVSVVFNKNGGNGTTPDSITDKEVGDVIVLPDGNGITKNRCTLIGWSTSASEPGLVNGTTPAGKVYPLGGYYEIDSADVNNKVVTLYAVWANDSLSGEIVIAVRNDGFVPAEPSEQNDKPYVHIVDHKKVTDLSIYFSPIATVAGVAEVEEALTDAFRAYARSEIDSSNKQAIKDISNKLKNGYHIEWYVIKHQANDNQWHIDGVLVNDSKVRVTYHPNGADTGLWPDASEVVKGTEVTIQGNERNLGKTGFEFAGWNTQADGQGVDYEKGHKFRLFENLDLYAKWTKKSEYTVKYELTGAPDGVSAPAEVKYFGGETVSVAADPSFEGSEAYTFSGWTTSDDVTVNNGQFTMPKANVTFTGSLTKSSFTVTVEKSTGIESVSGSGTYTSGNPVTVGYELETGYEFAGWTSDDVTVDANNSFTMPAKNVTVTATATPINYLITYKDGYSESQDGQGAVLYSKSHAYGTATPTITAPTRSYYNFTGWNPTVSATVQGEATYVATWEKTYTGTVSISAKTIVQDYNGQAISAGYESSGLPEGFKVANVKYKNVTSNTPGLDNVSITDAGSVSYEIESYDILDGQNNKVPAGYFSVNLSKGGTLTVNQLKVYVRTGGDEKVFDGTALRCYDFYIGEGSQTVALKDADGIHTSISLVEGETLTFTTTSFRILWGTEDNDDVTVAYSGTNAKAANYDPQYTYGVLKITKKNAGLEINASDGNFDYDGQPHTQPAFTVSDALKDFVVEANMKSTSTITNYTKDGVLNEIDPESVHIYLKNADGTKGNDVTENFENIQFGTGTLSINKLNITVKSDSDSRAYNGQPLKKESVQLIAGKLAAGQQLSQIVTFDEFASITDYGKKANTYKYHEIEAYAQNYNITYQEGELEITKYQGTVTLTAPDDSKDYDGTALTAKIVMAKEGKVVTSTGLIGGDYAKVVTDGSITNVEDNVEAGKPGNHTIKSYGIYRKGSDGKEIEVTSSYDADKITLVAGKLSINPVTYYVVTGSASKEYDGTPLTKTDEASIVGLVNGEDKKVTFTVTGTATEVTTEPVSNTYSWNWNNVKSTNYVHGTDQLGTLEITGNSKAQVTISVPSDAQIYNGVALSNGQATLAITGDSNITSGKFAITDVTYEKVATGTTANASNSIAITDAGSVTYRVAGYKIVDTKNNNADATNFFTKAVIKETGTLTVYPRTVKVTSASNHKMYDGSALTDSGYTEELVKSVTWDGKTYTQSGSTFIGNDGFTYNMTGSVTYVSDGTVQNKFTEAAKAGTTASNYTIVPVYGELYIEDRGDAKYSVEVKANSYEDKYDGQSHTAEGFKTTYPTANGTATVDGTEFVINGRTYKVENISASRTEKDVLVKTDAQGKIVKDENGKATVLDYPVAISGTAAVYAVDSSVPAGKVNVTDQFVVTPTDGKISISQRNVSLTSASGSKTYDGEALTSAWLVAKHIVEKEVTIGGDKFVDGEGATFDVTGSQTTPSFSANTFTYALNEGTLEQNYNITKTEGVLTVNSRGATKDVSVYAKSDSVIYDGESHQVNEFEKIVYNNAEFGVDNGLTFTDGKASYEITGLSVNAVDGAVNVIKTTDGIGSYPVTISVIGSGYHIYQVVGEKREDVTTEFKLTPVQGNLTIQPRKIFLTSQGATKEYDTDPLYNETVTISGPDTPGYPQGFVGNDGVTYSNFKRQTLATTADGVDNTFDYEFTGSSADNYDIEKRYGKLIVTNKKNPYIVNVKAKSLAETYTGKDISVSGFESSYDDRTFTYVQNKGLEFTQNGKKFYITGLTAGLTKKDVNREKASDQVESYEIPVVGTAKVWDVDGNNVTSQFTVNPVKGELKINPIAITFTSSDASKIYDGDPLTKDEVVVTAGQFANGESATFEVTGSVTDVTKPNTKNNNYFTYKFVNGLERNYDVTTVYGTLTVTDRTDNDKWVINLQGNSDSFKYDGEKHTVSGFEKMSFVFNGHTYFVSGIKSEAEKTDVMRDKDKKVVSEETNITGTAVVTDANGTVVTNSFKVNATPGTIIINPRQVTLTSESGKMKYDGTPLTTAKLVENHELEKEIIIGGEGFVKEQDKYLSFDITGSQTIEGSSDNKFTYKFADPVLYIIPREDIANNYDVTTIFGTLTVETRGDDKFEVTVVANSGEFLYDGTEKTVDGFEAVIVKKAENEYDRVEVENGALTFNLNGETFTISNVTTTKAAATHAVIGTAVDPETGKEISNEIAAASVNVSDTSKAVVTDSKGNPVSKEFAVYSKNGTLTINRRKVTLVAGSDSQVFDGTELKCAQYSIKTGEGIDGFAEYNGINEKAGITVKTIGSVVRAEDSPATNKIDSVTFDGVIAHENDYIVTTEDGELTITRPDTKVKLYLRLDIDETGKNEKFVTYDGTTQNLNVKIKVTPNFVITDPESTDAEDENKPVVPSDITDNTGDDNNEDASDLSAMINKLLSIGTITAYAYEGNDELAEDLGETATFEYGDYKFTVSGVKLEGGSGKDAGMYPVRINLDNLKVTMDTVGEVDDVFEVVIVPPKTSVEGDDVIGVLHITKRPVTLTSESASQENNGRALTRPNVTIGGEGFVEGEVINVRATGSITNDGSVENTIAYDFNPENEQGLRYLDEETGEELFENNYDLTLNPGTLTVYTPSSDNPPADPTTIPDAPVALAPSGAVLGAQRATGDGPAVLGARRAGTDDETNRMARVFAMVAAAAIAVTMMITGKKKDEEEEG